MKVTEYILTIYHPGTQSEWMTFTSETPFLAINKDDFIGPAITFVSQSEEPIFENKEGSGLKVKLVEHSIMPKGAGSGNFSHKIMVFTEESENPRA